MVSAEFQGVNPAVIEPADRRESLTFRGPDHHPLFPTGVAGATHHRVEGDAAARERRTL